MVKYLREVIYMSKALDFYKNEIINKEKEFIPMYYYSVFYYSTLFSRQELQRKEKFEKSSSFLEEKKKIPFFTMEKDGII